MLTWEDDVEVHALRKRGWSISAIARHTGFDRKTVRRYLNGEQKPGVRARLDPDPFDLFVDYVTARSVEDPHLWARTLFDELENLGFALSYWRAAAWRWRHHSHTPQRDPRCPW
jgi:transposase